MVENVSRALTVPEAVEQYHLRPCSFCKPPQFISKKNSVKPKTNKAVGTARTRRCQGLTKKGLRCKHRTSLSNGYCYQHVKQPDH